MKHLFKIALLILPVTLLSSCGGVKNYPYKGEAIKLEKPLKIEIQSKSEGVTWLTGDDLNSFYDKYLKNIKFLETEGRFFVSSAVLLWYEDRDIGLTVGCTNYGLLYIEDLLNMKFYAALEEINYGDFESDIIYYFDKNILVLQSFSINIYT